MSTFQGTPGMVQNTRTSPVYGYRKATVLLCYFPGDSNYAGQAADLARVFHSTYHFDTWLYPIPMVSPNATQAFFDKLEEWIRSMNGEDTLRIVYYIGHGGITGSSLTLSTKRFIAEGNQYREVVVDFSKCKLALQQASGMKCFLLDCCCAAAAFFDPNCVNRAFEVLAACGFDAETPVEEFTPKLIQELRAGFRGPITLTELNANMVRNSVNGRLSATPWHGVIGSSHGFISLRALHRRAIRRW